VGRDAPLIEVSFYVNNIATYDESNKMIVEIFVVWMMV
jgi:hypothetical protein